MAVQLIITDGTTTINLTNATGMQIKPDYMPVLSIPTGDGTIPPYVIEAIPVWVNIVDADGLAGTMQDLHALQLVAAEYWKDPTRGAGVWLTRQLTAETNARRTLVRTLQFDPVDEPQGSWWGNAAALSDGRSGILTIEHHPYNEATAGATVAAGAIACNGGKRTISGVAGDVLARIDELRFTPSGGTNPLEWDQGIYVGIRSQGKNGITLANTVFTWGCDNGGNAFNNNTVAGGGVATTDFTVVPTLAERIRMKMSTFVGGNYSDNYGTFLVVLTAYLAAAGTANVRMYSHGGGTNAGAFAMKQDLVQITSTTLTTYVLGTVTFPVVGEQALTTSYVANDDQISFDAQLYSGTAGVCDLIWDEIVLIPIDEAWMAIPQAVTASAAYAATDEYEITVLPTDDRGPLCHLATAGTLKYAIVPSMSESFGLRPGDNVIVVCGHTKTNVLVGLDYMERWVSLRGNE